MSVTLAIRREHWEALTTTLDAETETAAILTLTIFGRRGLHV
jgi:hypothetical protein